MSTIKIGRGTVEFCIICNCDIFYIKMGADGHIHPDVMEKGNSFTLLGGYGSFYDNCVFEAFICDECLSKAFVEGKVRIIDEA